MRGLSWRRSPTVHRRPRLFETQAAALCFLMKAVGTIRAPWGRVVAGEDQLRERRFARIETDARLRLVNLTDGASLARLGAPARLSTGDYALSRAASLALWNHPDLPDGLLYRALHAPERFAVAIFDRAADILTAIPWGSLLEGRNRGFVLESLERVGAAIV